MPRIDTGIAIRPDRRDPGDTRKTSFHRIIHGLLETQEGVSMNKAELINAIADHADLSKADAGRALDAVTDQIKRALKKGDDVSLVGFGTFVVRKRAARSGRNPRTGQTIKIKASKVPAFKAGKALKDALN
jgi:DNA-binding protein HU-beta